MRAFGLIAIYLLCLTPAALADTVELANGDKLSGTLQNLAAGRLSFETSYAGAVRIDWGQVRSLTTTGPYEVEFASGRRETGLIATAGEGTYRVGEVDDTFRPDEIVAIRAVPETGDVGILENWEANADFGYTTTRGNSNSTQLAIQFQPQRRTEADLIKVDVQSLRSVVNGGNSTNSHSAEARYDRFISPRWFVFALAKAENDEREMLQLRTREGGGFGFRLRPSERTTISAFGGSTFVQENFTGRDLAYSGEGLFGYELQTSIIGLLLTSRGQVLPSLTDFGRYRAEWDSAFRVPFARGVSFGLRLFHRFDSRPLPNVKRNDYGLVTTIGLSL